MTERCSCGATLVEGALFCHRCGKPQRDDLIERERIEREGPPVESATEAPIQTIASSEPPAGFNNRRAARAALLAAFLGFLLMSMLMAFIGGAPMVPVLIAAGFLTVYLYRRGAPQGEPPLSARLGARLGWMTGIYAFFFMLVWYTLIVLLGDTNFREVLRAQMAQQAAHNPELQNMVQVLNSTPGMTAIIGTSIVFFFITFTVLTTLGGALGAQFGAHPGGVKPDQKNLS